MVDAVKTLTKAVNAVKQGFSQYAPTRGIAFILGMGLLCYGIWLILPLDSFANPAYALMATLATKHVWGAIFTFSGSALMYGVFTKSEEWIQRGAWLGFFLWTIIAILGIFTVPMAPVHIVRMTIALMHAWVYIQVKLHPYLVSGYTNMNDLHQWVHEQHMKDLREND